MLEQQQQQHSFISIIHKVMNNMLLPIASPSPGCCIGAITLNDVNPKLCKHKKWQHVWGLKAKARARVDNNKQHSFPS